MNIKEDKVYETLKIWNWTKNMSVRAKQMWIQQINYKNKLKMCLWTKEICIRIGNVFKIYNCVSNI